MIRSLVAVALAGGLLLAPASATIAAGSAAAPSDVASAHATTPEVSPAPRGDTGKKSKRAQKMALIAYNGYYALDDAPDAFFYVDTNVAVTKGGAKRRYVVSLSFSLDGHTSETEKFKGQFVGRRLTQRTSTGTKIDLRFSRNGRTLGPAAMVQGTLKAPGEAAVAVSGATYGNPIPASSWGGHTYYLESSSGGKPVAVLKIGADGSISYNKKSKKNRLKHVKAYHYNLDMYYFSFGKVDLIMGTAGQAGLTTNNMTSKNGEVVQQRNLVTMPKAKAPTYGAENLYPDVGKTLTDFSGYYPIPTKKSPRAFVSIQGTSLADPSLSAEDLSRVLVSVSTDGKKVKSWYYDASQMSFNGKVLKMPKQSIKLHIKRKYKSSVGSLFVLKGKVKKRKVKGHSSFNSVPLSSFAGTMTNKSGTHELEITPAGDVTLDGVAIPNYDYVPMMYILAGPLPGTVGDQAASLLSLGSNGAKGLTSITTTDYGLPSAETFTLFAIP